LASITFGLGKLLLTFSRAPNNRRSVIRVLLKEYLRFDDLVSCSVPKLYAYVGDNPLSGRDPYGLFWMPGDPLNWGVANAITGFGDGVSRVLTLGITSTADFRSALNIGAGGVDMCSAAYKGGKYAGWAWGAATLGVGGLNGGTSSMFYAGDGSWALAFDAGGTTIQQTLVGSILDSMGAAVPRPIWQLASATFAANATDPAAAVLLYVAPTSIWNTESAVLAWRGISVIR
jgi:hypothetical protein